MTQGKMNGRRWLALGLFVAAPFALLVACGSSSSSGTSAGSTITQPGTAVACVACSKNADCVTGFACSGSVCTKQCTVDMDCAGVGPGACDQGVCGCKGHTTAVCSACTSTTDCVPGARCLLGACKPDVTQSACSATNACKAPLTCDPQLGCVCGPAGSVDAGQGAGTGTITVTCHGAAADAGVPTAFADCVGTAAFESGFAPGTGFTVTATTLAAGITELAYAGNVSAVPAAVSAGSISVAGPSATLTMSPDAKNAYAGKSASLGAVGSSLTITAAGGAVPAFNTKATLPTIASLTSPVQPVNGASFVIDRTTGLSAIASSNTDGKLVVLITSAKTASSFVVLRGEGMISGGSGGVTFTPSQLAVLPVGTGGTIQMYMAQDSQLTAGGTPVAITVASQLYDGNGDPVFASTPVTIQ
jgi:hypothetical protein